MATVTSSTRSPLININTDRSEVSQKEEKLSHHVNHILKNQYFQVFRCTAIIPFSSTSSAPLENMSRRQNDVSKRDTASFVSSLICTVMSTFTTRYNECYMLK